MAGTGPMRKAAPLAAPAIEMKAMTCQT